MVFNTLKAFVKKPINPMNFPLNLYRYPAVRGGGRWVPDLQKCPPKYSQTPIRRDSVLCPVCGGWAFLNSAIYLALYRGQ